MNMGIWPGFGIANAFYAILVPVLITYDTSVTDQLTVCFYGITKGFFS